MKYLIASMILVLVLLATVFGQDQPRMVDEPKDDIQAPAIVNLCQPIGLQQYSPGMSFVDARYHAHGQCVTVIAPFRLRYLDGSYPDDPLTGFLGNYIVIGTDDVQMQIWLDFNSMSLQQAVELCSTMPGHLVRVTFDPDCGLATSVEVLF